MSDKSHRRSRRLAKEPSEYQRLPSPKRRRVGDRGHPSQPSTLSTPSAPDWPQLATQAKARIDGYRASIGKGDGNLKPCLHAFVDLLPPGGRESVARDIIDCGDDDEKLFRVFENLHTSLLAPMKVLSRKSSVSSSPHLKRQDQVERVAEQLPGPSARSKPLRDNCLKRDDFRCVISRFLDAEKWNQLGQPDNEKKLPVEVAHIIPFSYASYENTDVPPKPITEMWATLYRCFPEVGRVGMKSDKINHPSNAITMAATLHVEFGKFNMALIQTDTENVYKLKTYRAFSEPYEGLLPGDSIVRLRQAEEGKNIPLPNPSFLRLHYTLAEILNASGMGSVLDSQMRDMADIGCLGEDGSTPIGLFLATAPWGCVA